MWLAPLIALFALVLQGPLERLAAFEELIGLVVEGRLEEAGERAALLERELDAAPDASVEARARAGAWVRFIARARALGPAEAAELKASYGLEEEALQRFAAREFAAAVAAWDRQIEIQEKLVGDLHPERVIQRIQRSRIAREGGLLQESQASAEEALALARARAAQSAGDLDLVFALADLGGHWVRAARYDLAEPLLAEACERSAGWSAFDYPVTFPARQIALDESARLARMTGREREGVRLNRALLELYGAVGDDSSQSYCVTLTNLAGLLASLGARAEAEAIGTRALEISERTAGPEARSTIHALVNLATQHLDVEAPERAEPLLRRVLERTDERDPLYPFALARLARIECDRGALATAEELARRGLELFLGQRAPDDPNCLLPRQILIEVHLERGELAAAEKLCLEALELYGAEQPGLHAWAALDLERTRTRIALQSGDLAQTQELLEATLAASLAGGEGLAVKASEDRAGLAAVLALQGLFEAALPVAEEACKSYERFREQVSGLSRATFETSPYRVLASVRLHRGDPTGAFEALERFQGRVLQELLDAAERERGGDELRLSLRAPASAAPDTPPSPAPTPAGVLARTAAEVSQALAADEALVGWLEVERRTDRPETWGYVLRREGGVRWTLLEENDGRELAELLEAFRAELAGAADQSFGRPPAERARELGLELWRRRLAPLFEDGALEGVGRLVLVPSGPMTGVAVEAFVDEEGRYLDERFEVSYAPSGALLAALRERGTRAGAAGARALLVGDPPFRPEHLAAMQREAAEGASASRSDERSAALPRLPHTRAEVQGLASLFAEAELLLGPDASEARLGELLEQGELAAFDVLHFATHALVDPVWPERSELVLSQVGLADPFEAALASTRVEDGRLSAAEIASTWRLDADLVTLSACQTALGRKVAGEGAVGLAHAFFRAGARNLVVSLWPVDDEATALFMERFYRELGSQTAEPSRTKTQALRAARAFLRAKTDPSGDKPYDHPAYWAAFVLFGG